MLTLVLMLCPAALTPPWVVLPQGCRAPADGVLYSIAADVERHADAAAQAERVTLCRGRLADARADVAKVTQAVATCEATCAADLAEVADDLDAAASALDVMAEQVASLRRAEAARLPAWVWVLAGAGAPLAAVGVCSDGRCSTLGTWAAAGGSLAAVAAAGVAWEW